MARVASLVAGVAACCTPFGNSLVDEGNVTALSNRLVVITHAAASASQNAVQCMGVILGSDTVVTAAQCVVDPGIDYSQSTVASTQKSVGIATIFLHPLFNRVDLTYDVAVLKVTEQLLTEESEALHYDSEGLTCFDDSLVLAFPEFEDNALSFNVSEVDCLASVDCEDASQGILRVNTSSMFCTISEGDNAATHESMVGAPLFVQGDDTGQWTLLGWLSTTLASSSSLSGNTWVNTAANDLASFLQDAASAAGGSNDTSLVGFPAACIDCDGAPCSHYITSLGDGVCDRGVWGPNFFCATYFLDDGDCASPQWRPCTDCQNQTLNCSASSPNGVLLEYELLLGDGECQGSGGASIYDFNCSAFEFDHGDCLSEPASQAEFPVGVDAETGKCYDCSRSGNDCTDVVIWLGDGACDAKAGAFGVDFQCAAFNFDEGDCAILTTQSEYSNATESISTSMMPGAAPTTSIDEKGQTTTPTTSSLRPTSPQEIVTTVREASTTSSEGVSVEPTVTLTTSQQPTTTEARTSTASTTTTNVGFAANDASVLTEEEVTILSSSLVAGIFLLAIAVIVIVIWQKKKSARSAKYIKTAPKSHKPVAQNNSRASHPAGHTEFQHSSSIPI